MLSADQLVANQIVSRSTCGQSNCKPIKMRSINLWPIKLCIKDCNIAEDAEIGLQNASFTGLHKSPVHLLEKEPIDLKLHPIVNDPAIGSFSLIILAKHCLSYYSYRLSFAKTAKHGILLVMILSVKQIQLPLKEEKVFFRKCSGNY